MNPSDFTHQAPGRLIETPAGHAAYLPNPLPPVLDGSNRLMSALSQAEARLAALEEIGKAFLAPKMLARPFIRKEAMHSCRIEGIRTSFESLLSYEAGLRSLGRDLLDARDVQNTVQAMENGLDQILSQPFSTGLIRELHTQLFEGIRGEWRTPREFREAQNWIGGPGTTLENTRYIPPPVPEMKIALVELENFIHSGSDLPELIRIGLINYQFEAIHPFLDGNGRIGRLLIPLLLAAWGKLSQPLLTLSAYFETHQLDYYDHLLDVTQKSAWEKWLIFFLQGVASQAEGATHRIQRLTDLRQTYHRRFADQRSRQKLAELVDFLIGTPITSIQQAQESLKMGSYTTIQRQIEKLAALGIVHEITGQHRNRLYQADEILQIMIENE
ncbi:Fic family protein (plasmid) [Chloroflexota bacterium]|nr:Fic family protein [Chloroflexota bacterium]